MNSRKIPYVDIAGQHRSIKPQLLKAVEAVIDHGKFILGPEVEELEKRFAKFCGTSYAVGVNSGTDALILSLRALEIGSGDEVITVPNSFISTASAVILVGAKPVFVDVRDDYNIDPVKIQEAISARTKAIIPVHLTGRPCEMNPILEIAKKHHLHVIEDAAQAVGAEYRDKKVGSFGLLGCFSLHPLKTLNACGDGGIITTNNGKLFGTLKMLRNIGLQNRNDCTVWSGNSRLDTLQAAVVLAKLHHLDQWTEKRREHARFYREALTHVSQIQCPQNNSDEKCVYHTFVIQADDRDKLKVYLADRGIETAIHYPIPIHLQSVAGSLNFKRGAFPMAEAQAERILSLPIYPELQKSDLKYICDEIKQFYRRSK